MRLEEGIQESELKQINLDIDPRKVLYQGK